MEVITPPDRVSVDRDSPFFTTEFKHLGVKFDGRDMVGVVQEYCVSEGWIDTRIRTADGGFQIKDGRYVLHRLIGKVEPYWKVRQKATSPRPAEAHVASIRSAVEKRQRKAAKRLGAE